MSKNAQRKAYSLHRLLQGSRSWKRFPAKQHVDAKALLHTDVERVLTAFAEAGLSSLMEWEYYQLLTVSDHRFARKVRLAAEARGIPEQADPQ